MPGVTVVDVADVASRDSAATGLTVWPTLGPDTGFDALEQAVLSCPPGRSRHIDTGEVEETLFVLEGEGVIHVGGDSHPLEPEVGVYLPPGSRFELESSGDEGLRVLAVRVPDPSPGPPSPPRVCRLADQPAQAATTNREFRIVADPGTGLRSATHFVGSIPTQRAPEHFHTYDEVIYVLEGQGVMHAGSLERPVAPGACIQLPARTVHCLENTGSGPMRVVAVFRPAGSPAAAFYPDGTPAYQANQDTLQRRRDL
jgi:mannose-6-phosphate isomerase-like protein (cupin superfamily)